MCIYAKQEISSFTRWQAVYTQNVAIARKSDVSYFFIFFFMQPHVFAQCRGLSNKWVSRDAPSIWQWEWGRKGEERGKSNFRFVCRESENAQNMYWQSLHSLVTAPIAPQKFAAELERITCLISISPLKNHTFSHMSRLVFLLAGEWHKFIIISTLRPS